MAYAYHSLIGKLGLLLLSVILMAGCTTEPKFSDSPKISHNKLWFKKGVPYMRDGLPFSEDTLFLELNFQDGDGDLGLSSDDIKKAPYLERNADQSRNENHYNVLVDFYQKASAQAEWQLVLPRTGALNYSGRFPRLRTNEERAPIEGVVRFAIPSEAFPKGQSVKIAYFIKDRKLNNSNIVTSEAVTIPR